MGDARVPSMSRPGPSPLRTDAPQFYVVPGSVTGDRASLDADETRHLHVRRLRTGDAVTLFDGTGHSWRGTLAAISRRSAEIAIDEQRPDRSGESDLALTLAVAVLKADRMDWVVEKATELGVYRIRPFSCRYSVARPSPSRQDRWRQIALSAAKQCRRSVVPAIDAAVPFEHVLADSGSLRILLWEGEDTGSRDGLASRAGEPREATVAVGPEGGFTLEEVASARAAGFRSIGLGPRTLRADSAAIAAVALCQHLWGDL